MAKKPRIEDIADKKARGLPADHQFLIAVRHLRSIEHAIDEIEEALDDKTELEFRDELYRGVPVLVTASIEAYVRSTIGRLIDLGPPFRNRAKKLNDIRIDVEAFLAMEGTQVTLGDLVANSLSFNNPRDLAAGYELVTDGRNLWADAAGAWDAATGPVLIPSDPKETQKYVVAQLSRLYEIRHIVCHEARSNAEVEAEDAKAFCHIALALVVVTDYLVDVIIAAAKLEPLLDEPSA